MTAQVLELAARGRTLTKGEQGQLIDLLLAGLDTAAQDDIGAAWDSEIERRNSVRKTRIRATDPNCLVRPHKLPPLRSPSRCI